MSITDLRKRNSYSALYSSIYIDKKSAATTDPASKILFNAVITSVDDDGFDGDVTFERVFGGGYLPTQKYKQMRTLKEDANNELAYKEMEELRKQNMRADLAVEKVNEDYPYLQWDTIRKIVYGASK